MQKIRTALCSFGMSGKVFHAPFLTTHPGFELYAVCERSSDNASKLFPAIKVFKSIGDMLRDEAIDLVIVNTPNVLHYEHCKSALLAGKHVICEKPFTVTTEQADDLIQVADSNKKKLVVYHNRRYDSDFRTIKKVLDQQILGNIVEAEFHFDRYKNELSPKTHKETAVKGTGALYDLGSHLIDQALQLFGWPQAVFADIVAMRPISEVDDYFELLLYYPQMRVRIKGSYQVREALPGYIIHGNKGSFIKPKTDVQETQLQSGMLPTDPGYGVEPGSEMGLLHVEINKQLIREYIPSETGDYTDFYEAVYRAIAYEEPIPVSPQEARNVIRIIEGAFQSVNEKRLVDL